MQKGSFQPNGQPWTRKQRKASRYHNHVKGGFNRSASTQIDLKAAGQGRGMLAGLMAGILGMAMGRRKRV